VSRVRHLRRLHFSLDRGESVIVSKSGPATGHVEQLDEFGLSAPAITAGIGFSSAFDDLRHRIDGQPARFHAPVAEARNACKYELPRRAAIPSDSRRPDQLSHGVRGPRRRPAEVDNADDRSATGESVGKMHGGNLIGRQMPQVGVEMLRSGVSW